MLYPVCELKYSGPIDPLILVYHKNLNRKCIGPFILTKQMFMKTRRKYLWFTGKWESMNRGHVYIK